LKEISKLNILIESNSKIQKKNKEEKFQGPINPFTLLQYFSPKMHNSGSES
jgi:hypothetical protein